MTARSRLPIDPTPLVMQVVRDASTLHTSVRRLRRRFLRPFERHVGTPADVDSAALAAEAMREWARRDQRGAAMLMHLLDVVAQSIAELKEPLDGPSRRPS